MAARTSTREFAPVSKWKIRKRWKVQRRPSRTPAQTSVSMRKRQTMASHDYVFHIYIYIYTLHIYIYMIYIYIYIDVYI